MAYVVGSASVEIVPDFRNAQRKIDEFFARQPNRIEIPVDLKVDQEALRQLREERLKDVKGLTDEEAKLARAREVSEARLARLREETEAKLARQRERDDAVSARRQEQVASRLSVAEQKAAAQRQRDEERAARLREAEELRLARQREALEARVAEAKRREDQRSYEAEQRQQRILDQQRERARLKDENDRLKFEREYEIVRLRAEQKIGTERERTLREAERIKARFDFSVDEESRRKARTELNALGKALGVVFGDSVVRNAQHEIRSRALFLGSVVGGILAAGAPAVLAGAVALFSGVGLLAAAQTAEIKEAWASLWVDIRGGAQAAAQSLNQTSLTIIANIRDRFGEIQPQLARIFQSTAPLIESFTNSLLDAVQIVLPGFENVLKASGPVVEGFGNLLRSTSSGLRDFFNILASQGVGASGRVFSELGDILAQLLPSLGQLLVDGAQIAANLLPALTGGFTILNTALRITGPLLVPVLQAFLAFRALRGLGGVFESLETGLINLKNRGIRGVSDAAGLAERGLGRLTGTADDAGGAVKNVGAIVAGTVAIVGTLFTLALQKNQEAITTWRDALLKGGDAADSARRQMKALQFAIENNVNGAGLAANVAKLLSGGFIDISKDAGEAEKQVEEYTKSLSPLEQANLKVAQATAHLEEVTGKSGDNEERVQLAKNKLNKALEFQRIEQAKVNAAIADSVPAAKAAADAEKEYQAALSAGDTNGAAAALDRFRQKTAEASVQQAKFNRAVEDIVPSTEAASAAQEDYFAALARGDLKGAGEAVARYRRETQEATNEQDAFTRATQTLAGAIKEETDALRAQFDHQFAARQAVLDTKKAYDDYKKALADSGPLSDDVTQATLDLEQALLDQAYAAAVATADQEGLTEGTAKYNATVLKEQIQNLKDLQQQYPELADTIQPYIDQLQSTLDHLDGIDNADATAEVDLDLQKFDISYKQVIKNLLELGGSKAEAKAELDTGQFEEKHGQVQHELANFDGAKGTAQLDADKSNAERAIDAAVAELRGYSKQKPTVELGADDTPVKTKLLGVNKSLIKLGLQQAVPSVGLNTKLFDIASNATLKASNILNAQRPTPIASMNRVPFTITLAIVNSLLTVLQNRVVFPTTSMNTTPFRVAYAFINGVLDSLSRRVVAPTVSAIDHATATIANIQHQLDALSDRTITITANQAGGPIEVGGVLGSAAVTPGVANLFRIIKSAFPNARLNSGYRPGDPGYHGLGLAADFGEEGFAGGDGRPYLAAINRYIYDHFGSKTAELIYDGLGDDRPDIKNGVPHTYDPVTRAAHHNHVHWAVAKGFREGGALVGPGLPGVDSIPIFGAPGEHMLDARDVALMGGQAAVYQFRDALNNGLLGSHDIGGPVPDYSSYQIMRVIGNNGDVNTSVTGLANYGTIVTTDLDGMFQRAEASKRATLVALGLV